MGTRLIGRVKLGREVIVSPSAIIYDNTRIGDGTYIGPNSILAYPPRGSLSLAARMGEHMRNEAPTSVGKEVTIRSNCVLYSGSTIGDGVEFGHNVMVRENVRVGDRTLIGTNTVIDGNCEVGKRVSIQTGAYLSYNTIIKDDVFLGPHCTLINDKYMGHKPVVLKGPVIEAGASVGCNATVFPEVIVGEKAMIGAGSVVTEDVPPYTIVTGVPARKIGTVPK
ncbi:MAG: acyltransferase [Candidatus Bathyarchaeia archaeon]